MVSKFLKRWSSNKLTSQHAPDAELKQELPAKLDHTLPETGDADTPVASETTAPQQTPPGTSDEGEELTVAGMLASGVTGAVKKQALRKLFLSGEFADVDNLNDYDHDYKAVKSLSQDAAKHLRNWLEEQAEDDQSDLAEEQDPDVHHFASTETSNAPHTPASISQQQDDLPARNDQDETKSTI